MALLESYMDKIIKKFVPQKFLLLESVNNKPIGITVPITVDREFMVIWDETGHVRRLLKYRVDNYASFGICKHETVYIVTGEYRTYKDMIIVDIENNMSSAIISLRNLLERTTIEFEVLPIEAGERFRPFTEPRKLVRR